ncbi:MAG: cell wall-active antibiotics response protein [Cytophagales bacterium]|nr:cell wall-active antibiotics response protein [Cytophagales bacterium]
MAPFVKDKRHLVGLILILIGLVLIIDNLRFIPAFIPWWIWTWQFLLITIGVFSLLTTEKVGPGILLIGIGTIFLLPDILPQIWPGFLNLFSNSGSIFWYLLIIVVGASLILRKREKHREGPTKRHPRRPGFSRRQDSESSTFFTGTSDNDYVDEVAIFGGGKKIITSDNFKGGKVTAIFGGSEIVLTQSQLAPGINEIEVFAMFGGWTLVVPPNWQVKSEVVAVFGGISDKRVISPETIKDDTRQLIIKGFVMFGGGEIKSY